MAGERIRATEADRTDDVRRVAAGDLRRERVVGLRIQDELALDLDVGVRRVEVLDDLLLDLDLLGIVAGAQAAIPADQLDAWRNGLRGNDDGRRRGRP